MNPFLAIETAVTRSDADAVYPGVLNADEAVSLHQAIAAYTLEGAYLMHQEADLGALKEGMLADLVVIDRNLFEIPPASIGDTQVLLTLLGGEVVYEQTLPAPSDEQEQEHENDAPSVKEGS
jgi:predicted amidohydrolase YtcJ